MLKSTNVDHQHLRLSAMYNNNHIQKCLFFDIETVSRYPDFEEFENNEPEISKIWLDKIAYNDKMKDNPRGNYATSACLYPEYGKIACIAYGYWDISDEKWKVEHLDVDGSDEKSMLVEFAKIVNTKFRTHLLSGFNIKNFDIPYIYRRMLINNILPPSQFDMCEKKPWDIKAYDLYKVWSEAGSINGMCTFELVCLLMGIASPKTGEVSGSGVGAAFFEGKIKEISEYCRKDVSASIKLAVRFSADRLEEHI